MKRYREWSLTVATVLGVAVLALPALATDVQTNRRIPYQGRLTGSTAPGAVTVFVTLSNSRGETWGPESHVVTPDEQGNFAISLDRNFIECPHDQCQPNGTAVLQVVTRGDGGDPSANEY